MAKINAIVIIQWFDGKKVTQTLHCSHIHVNPDAMRTVGYFSAFLWAVQLYTVCRLSFVDIWVDVRRFKSLFINYTAICAVFSGSWIKLAVFLLWRWFLPG